MGSLIEKINFVLGYKEDTQYIDYLGLSMVGEDCRELNFNLLKEKFPDYFIDLSLNDFQLHSHKGNIEWGNRYVRDFSKGEKHIELQFKDFTGETTPNIIEWLIINKPWINEEEITRTITKEMRYIILKKQQWHCNICGEKLKYDKNSNWDGKVAHIDHIFPFSKRKHYPNGIKNINEFSNLQGLCPDCNLKKGKKDVQ